MRIIRDEVRKVFSSCNFNCVLVVETGLSCFKALVASFSQGKPLGLGLFYLRGAIESKIEEQMV